jgi:hypothetical protein
MLGAGMALLAASAGVRAQTSKAGAIPVEVWKDVGCGCCQDWVSHLEANGFTVTVHEGGNQAQRARLGVGNQYSSCHTGVVAGYALEGHVPAREIHRLLKEKPAAIGLAVPGMKVGSPGMDGASYGGRREAYEVLLLAKSGGGARVYQRYAAIAPKA